MNINYFNSIFTILLLQLLVGNIYSSELSKKIILIQECEAKKIEETKKCSVLKKREKEKVTAEMTQNKEKAEKYKRDLRFTYSPTDKNIQVEYSWAF